MATRRHIGRLAAALAVLAAPGAARAAEVVDAGALRAAVDPDPWRLVLTDERGATVLAERAATDAGPAGTLGFRTAGGWRHATRVVEARRDGAAYVAMLATTDPLRRIAVRIAPAGEGVVAIEASVDGPRAGVTALGVGFDGRAGERYLGFGERSNAVDQRGNTVETYVADGPYQPEERPFVPALVPPPGAGTRDDSTYFPIPWLLSTHGYGVLVDNTHTAYHRLGGEAWSVEVVGGPEGQDQGPAPERLVMRVFAGPRPADVLRRFTRATGRQPRAAAPWVYGAWFQPTGSTQERADALAKLVRADAPLSVAQTYTHYLPCGDQRGRREDERARVRDLHDAGLAVTTYFNPMICTGYEERFDEAAAQDGLTKTQSGQPYLYRYTGSTQFLVGQFDFTSPGGHSVFRSILAEGVEDGHDGWMEDFGEYTPLDSRSTNGMDGREMHNLYPRLYHCSSKEFRDRRPRPIVSFVRSGFTGEAPCASVVWGGDPSTVWGFDGLASAVRQVLSLGTSGIAIWGSDIGGFFAFNDRALTPEMLTRWVQFGALSPVMRTQANGFALPERRRPQIWDDGQIANWRRWAKLHTQLLPYLEAAESEYRRSGMPIVRHLALVDPGDPRAAEREDEFLLGPDLLAAPVLEPGARRRSAYLPRGRWIDLWRSAHYDVPSGGLRLGRARRLPGGRGTTVPAPLDELPLFVRAGAVLPLLPADVDTLAGYGSRGGVVRLGDRPDRIELLAFPRGRTSAGLHRDGTLTSREGRGRWTLSVRGRRVRRFALQASLAGMKRPIRRVCRVSLGGRSLAGWRYSSRKRLLRVSFRTRSGTLDVRACPGR